MMMICISRPKVLIFVPLILLLVGLIWFMVIPPSRTADRKVIFIKRGMPLKRVSLLLEQEGIIRSHDFFNAMTTVLGKRGGIMAGEYELHTRMLPFQVLSALTRGQAKRHPVTIPEGYTLIQIAQLLQDLGIVDGQAFIDKTSSPTFVATLGLTSSGSAGHGATLEGYLFPDTYHFVKEMTPEQVIQMMVNRFKKVFTPDLTEKAFLVGFSEREVVILASIIEKETSLREEKPLISAVFHNRLKKKMPLQSDPTVIYGIKGFDGNLKKEHLTKPTPYNTYLVLGLPPTPICNPGQDSMEAAVSPAPVPYLYFVSKNDGSHHFSATIEEHNRAVIKYQTKNNLTKR